jgi:hypothetical protein
MVDRNPDRFPIFAKEQPDAGSIARRIASRLFAIGTRCAFSKSRTVLSDTLARFANSVCDHPNHPRAARLCSGDMAAT